MAACGFVFAGTTVPIFVNGPFPFFLNSSNIFDLLSASVGSGLEFILVSDIGVDFGGSVLPAEVGVTGVGLGGAVGLEEGFTTVFGVVTDFADTTGFSLTDFETTLVDFALVADFPSMSGFSTSIGSERTFFGLPLFLTTSEDIVQYQLSCARI